MLGRTMIAGTDLAVSPLCFGTAPLGSAVDQGCSDLALDSFVELGGNFIDTARMYGDWNPTAPVAASEQAVGDWLRRRRVSGLVVATKGGGLDFRVGDWRNRVTPEDLAQDIAESLEHLGVRTIDLYWLHADNPQAPVGPIMDALFQHRDAGHLKISGRVQLVAATHCSGKCLRPLKEQAGLRCRAALLGSGCP
jgi:aryl-alcohol dehydrogenase-like predicted oxidoreductase